MAKGENLRYRGFAIALAIFGIGIVLSFGLCAALGATGGNSVGTANFAQVFIILFFLSLLGFIVTFVSLVIAIIVNALSKK